MFERRYRQGWRFSVKVIEAGEMPSSAEPDNPLEVLLIRNHGHLLFPSVEENLQTVPHIGDKVLMFSSVGTMAARASTG